MSDYEQYLASKTQSNFHLAEFSLNFGPIVADEEDVNGLSKVPDVNEVSYKEKSAPKKIRNYLVGEILGEGKLVGKFCTTAY